MDLNNKKLREAALNRDRVKRFRDKLYKNNKRHGNLKLVDQLRKRVERSNAVNNESAANKDKNRKKERERKRLYRQKKALESTSTNEKFDARRIKKNALRRQRHKLTKEMEAKIDVLSLMGKRKREQKDDEDEDDANETNTSLAEVIWDNMTPLSKKRTKLSMESRELPPNTKRQARKDLGINFSNTVDIRCEKMTSLQERIEIFFNRDDISRVCPDRKKVATNPTNALERKPIRYQLGHSKLLHAKFMAEDVECLYPTFTKYIPYYVRKPSATDWGTSLCGTCLNPEIKLERLVATKRLESQIVAEEVVSNQMQFDELLLKLNIIGDNAKKDTVFRVDKSSESFVEKRDENFSKIDHRIRLE